MLAIETFGVSKSGGIPAQPVTIRARSAADTREPLLGFCRICMNDYLL
jgi:hypothetical protein